jgi:C1A family cysteine protease
VLREYGACLDKTWPYVTLPVGPSEGQGPPPDGAEAEALAYVWRHVRRVAAKVPDRIRQQIDEERPVVLSVKTFPAWDYPTTQDTGEIPLPIPGQVCDGGHAVCVVGYELGATWPGGGAFIFRNSWGAKWAKPQGRLGGGYGTLPFAYVRKYGLEAFA